MKELIEKCNITELKKFILRIIDDQFIKSIQGDRFEFVDEKIIFNYLKVDRASITFDCFIKKIEELVRDEYLIVEIKPRTIARKYKVNKEVIEQRAK